MRLLRALALLLLALTFPLSAQAREWLRAQTPRFVVYSDGYPQELERWARKLAMFDAVLKSIYGGGDDLPGSPLTVFLLSGNGDVAALAGQKNLTGFYGATSEGSYAVASRKPGYFDTQLSGQMTLFHEYGHHFMFRHLPGSYPVWYREGFAEYVSTTSFDQDWRWTFGRPSPARMKLLRKDPLSIATILTASVDDFRPNDKARFYAWSWRLVAMLNAVPERKAQLARYLELCARGTPLRQAASVFGDLSRLESDLRAWPAETPGPLADHPPVREPGPVTVSPLGPLASQLLDLRLERLAGKGGVLVLAQLRELSERHPDDPAIALELAEVLRDAAQAAGGDFAPAQAAADKAGSLAPGNARAAAIAADIAMRQFKRHPGAGLGKGARGPVARDG